MSLFRKSGKPRRMPLLTNSCGEPEKHSTLLPESIIFGKASAPHRSTRKYIGATARPLFVFRAIYGPRDGRPRSIISIQRRLPWFEHLPGVYFLRPGLAWIFAANLR